MNNVKKIDECEITNDLISWSVTAGFSENAKEKLENEQIKGGAKYVELAKFRLSCKA